MGQTSEQTSRPVLVVEDDADIREALVDLLSSAGYSVTAFGDGEAAWEAVQGGLLPSLLLTDLTLPTMSGLQLITALRAEERACDVPAVLATANEAPARVPLHTHFLRKPFDIDRLMAIVDAEAKDCTGSRPS